MVERQGIQTGSSGVAFVISTSLKMVSTSKPLADFASVADSKSEANHEVQRIKKNSTRL